jgi:hypothetical protein
MKGTLLPPQQSIEENTSIEESTKQFMELEKEVSKHSNLVKPLNFYVASKN